MKGRKLMILAIIVLAIGVVLTITYTSIKSTGVVICGGILFILAGLINLIPMFGTENGKDNNEEDKKRGSHQSALRTIFGWITSTAAIVLGVCMLIFQPTFSTLVPIIFAVLVLSCGLFQFYILAIAIRPITLPAWTYIGGILLIGAAIFLFTLDAGIDDKTLMLTTGISMLVFGVITLIEGFMVGASRRKMFTNKSINKSDNNHNIMDVEPTEIKSLDSPK